MLIEILLGSQVVALTTPWFERVFDAIDDTTKQPFRSRPRRRTWTLYIQSMIAAALSVCIYISAVEILSSCLFNPNAEHEPRAIASRAPCSCSQVTHNRSEQGVKG